MSLEAVDRFRSRINEDEQLKQEATAALNAGLAEVVALGAQYGYIFTEAEAEQALGRYMKDGELSDYELELVSAGSGCPSVASA